MSEGARVSNEAATSKWSDLLCRLRLSPGWVAAQYWATLLILLAGIAWTRLPDKYAWQVGLTLLIPLMLLAALLVLEAGTMRKLVNDEQGRVGMIHGALTLLVWIAFVLVAWTILGWCDDQTFLWSGYLNSRVSAHLRARILTYQHIQLSISTLIWIFRWIVVPAKVIPPAIASAQWGWRLPWRRLIRLMLNWRWWLAIVIAALMGVALPGRFFAGLPTGTVSHQIWAVILKLVGAWLLAVTSWVLALAWGVVLLARVQQPAPDGLDQRLFACLWSGRKWILGWAGWVAASMLFDFIMDALPENLRISGWVNTPVAIVLMIAALVLQVGMTRAMTRLEEKQVRPVWSALSVLVWLAAAVGLWFLLSLWHHEVAEWIVDWIIIPALLIPFAASSARWGLKLPWRRIFSVLCNWRWWVGVIAAVIVGVGLPDLIKAVATGGKASQKAWLNTLWNDVPFLLTMAAWIVLMGWFAALMTKPEPHSQTAADSPPLETGEGTRGNA